MSKNRFQKRTLGNHSSSIYRGVVGKLDTLKIDDGHPPEWTESTDFARTSVGQMTFGSLCDSRVESPEASSQRGAVLSLASSIGFAMPVSIVCCPELSVSRKGIGPFNLGHVRRQSVIVMSALSFSLPRR